MFDANRLNWPTSGDINAWADYVETLCILSTDGLMSIEDFTDFLFDDQTKDSKQILAAVNFNEDFLAPLSVAAPVVPLPILLVATDEEEVDEEEADEEEADEEEADDEEFDGDDIESRNKELVRSRLIKLFNFLQARKRYFVDSYPFNVADSDLTITVISVAEQSRIQKIYQVLLFSSEMNLFASGDMNRVGHLFELLCKKPFYQLVPAIAEKRFFGAGAGEVLPGNYQGNLNSRLKSLAKDLSSNTKPIIEDADELGKTGDAGLDWVGWVSFEDDCNHQPIYFGQCACGANWVDKQHETSLSHWNNYLDLSQSVQCFHFMPRSFRRNALTWFRETKIITGLTLIDRYRMLKLIRLEEDDVVDEMLGQYSAMLQEANDFALE